jgi:hypothetical protein
MLLTGEALSDHAVFNFSMRGNAISYNPIITLKWGIVKMSKEEMQEIKKVMKSFDPVLVSMAIGEIGVNSELVNKEVSSIRSKLKKFDKNAVARAAADYTESSSMVYSCGGPVCTCPEDGGCGKYTIRTDAERSVRELGLSVVTAAKELDNNKLASAVVGTGDKLGYAALCWDTVRCTGKQIYVMHECLASLYSFDIGAEVINPVNAIVTLSKSNPTLYKRVNKMVAEMNKAGEL